MANLDPLTNGSYWGPKETHDEILLEQTFMFSAFVTGMAFAVQFVFYIGVMKTFLTRRNATPSSSWTLMTHSSAMCMANLFTVVPVYVSLQETYIHNRDFPGGIPAYFGASTRLWYNVASVTGLVAGATLSNLVLLWRCRVIWSLGLNSEICTNAVMMIPTLLTLATIVVGIVWTALTSSSPSSPDLKVEHLRLIYFSLSVILNVLLTGMIAIRMKSYQKNLEECMGKKDAERYVSMSTILVESAAVYTILALPLLITTATNSPLSQLLLAIAPPTQICCSYFIIRRVADGRAWSVKLKRSTKPHESASILEFGKRNKFTLTSVSPGEKDGSAKSIPLVGLPDKVLDAFDF